MRRKLTKGSALLVAILFTVSILGSALADTYTSGSFSIPSNRISTKTEQQKTSDVTEEPAEGEELEQTEEPAEGEEPGEEEEPAEGEEPGEEEEPVEGEEPGEEEEPVEGEEPGEEEEPDEGEEPGEEEEPVEDEEPGEEEPDEMDLSQLELWVEIVNSLGVNATAPVGTSVTLQAKLSDDFAKVPAYTLQWQESRDNASWADIPGATESTYSTALPEGDIFWRLTVTIPD